MNLNGSRTNSWWPNLYLLSWLAMVAGSNLTGCNSSELLSHSSDKLHFISDGHLTLVAELQHEAVRVLIEDPSQLPIEAMLLRSAPGIWTDGAIRLEMSEPDTYLQLDDERYRMYAALHYMGSLVRYDHADAGDQPVELYLATTDLGGRYLLRWEPTAGSMPPKDSGIWYRMGVSKESPETTVVLELVDERTDHRTYCFLPQGDTLWLLDNTCASADSRGPKLTAVGGGK